MVFAGNVSQRVRQAQLSCAGAATGLSSSRQARAFSWTRVAWVVRSASRGMHWMTVIMSLLTLWIMLNRSCRHQHAPASAACLSKSVFAEASSAVQAAKSTWMLYCCCV